MRARWLIVAAVAAAVVAGGAVLALNAADSVAGEPTQSAAVPMQERSDLARARLDCLADGALTETHDGQITLVITAGVLDTEFDEPIAELEAAYCVLEKVGAPVAVVEQVKTTRAIDGMQRAEWEGCEASWTYHPDNGLHLILAEK
jgi:hypothetical protein